MSTEIHLDPDNPLKVQLVLSTPTGDRAQEAELAKGLAKQAVAASMYARMAVGLHQGLLELVASVRAGETDKADAWERVERLLSEAAAEEEEG